MSCGQSSDRTFESGTTRKVSVVEFDIVLSNNGEDSDKNGHSQTTSVKFAIPIVYPYRE